MKTKAEILAGIGERVAQVRDVQLARDAKSVKTVTARETKTKTITIRVTPGYAKALRTYVEILQRDGIRIGGSHIGSVAELMRRMAHIPMSRRLALTLDLMEKAEGEERKRLHAEAMALAGYTVAELQ